MPTTTATSTLTYDADMFAYTALSIMAGAGGATVQIDADNNGSFEQTVALAEGGTSYLTGVSVGGRILSDKPVQVVLFTGRPGSNYQSRDTSLLPVGRWSSSYYAPVSTTATYGTSVFVYNPGASAITVSYDYRSSASAYTTATVSVPAGGNARVTLTASNGTNNFGAYRFYTTGASFYAFCAVDGASATTTDNQSYDGGFTLVGQPSLTTQVLVSLGIGRDLYSTVNPTENGNPVWITTVGNGNTLETVYVDYNGDNAGPLTDSNGNKYDVAYSLRELQQQKILDPDGDQSGMLIYALNPNVKIAAAWAQDPAVTSPGAPGLDVSTLVPPLREGDASKGSSVAVDADGDGYCSAGDTLDYDIRVINTARTSLNGPFTVQDNFPADMTYVAGTTRYRFGVNDAWQAWVTVPDDGSGTAFPLDSTGYAIPGTLGYGQQIQVVFRAVVDTYPNLTAGTSAITNTGTVAVTPLGLTIALNWSDALHGSIGDRVRIDANGNGVQDSGESGLNGVIVFADLDNDGVRDANEATATTSGNGAYVLTGLLAGTYTVRVDPASVAAIDPKYGPTDDLDGIATSYVAAVTLAAAQDRVDADFGFRIGASVGDRVWVDRDADGVQESGEPCINGVRVYLDSNSNGTYDIGEPNSITFGDGTYYIGNLNAGTYKVRIDTSTLPGGSTQTFDLDGTGTANQTSVTLLGAEHRSDLDFGYRGALSIGDLVWEDFNADGVKDVSELGIANVRVYIDSNGNGAWDSTEAFATSNASGIYSIGNLFNASYVVRVDTTTLPVSVFETYDLTSPTTDHQATVVLSGASRTDVDFGYRNDATLGDRVWNDLNNNGSQDAGEPGIAGVAVFIDADANGVLNPLLERYAITDLRGNYLINNLAAGNYAVRVDIGTLPQGSTQTFDFDGTATANSASRTLTASEEATNVDFGYRSSASIGNFVWLDADGDGVQDAGEAGMNGVRVYLDINGNDSFDSATEPSTITAGNGAYAIAGVVPGTYTARVDTTTLPVGVVQTYDLAGDLDHAATVALSASQVRTDLDFGYVLPVAIGDWVWNDLNANGVQDTGEPGIDGVTVTVYNATDNTVAGTTTTAGGGLYRITNLLSGTYLVEFGSLSGYGRTFANLGTDDTKDSDANAGTGRTGNYLLAAGVTNNTVDAGYFQSVTLGDLVFNDANANGVRDSGEPGLAGVLVSVYRPGFGPDGVAGTTDDASAVAAQTTLAGGAYSFTNLPPGIYQVGFGTLAGYGRTLADQGADDTKDSDASASTGLTDNYLLVAGTTIDAGYQAVSIGDFIWTDRDADGVQDPNETGIAGVQVQVYTSGGVAYQGRMALGIFADSFDPAGGLTGSSGSLAWASNWAATSNAAVVVNTGTDYEIRIADTANSTLTRSFVVPTNTARLTISYDYRASGSGNDTVSAQWSSDGTTWTTLASYNTSTGGTGTASFPVTTTAGTRYVRFSKTAVSGGGGGTEYMYFDNVSILAETALANAIATTDANGYYFFGASAGLVSGTNYQLRVATSQAPLTGVLLTAQDQGGNDTTDSDATLVTASGFATIAFAAPTSGTNITLDFGFKGTASLGDRVWNDTNANGLQDSGETGIDGVVVTLYNASGNSVERTTTTAGGGLYSFGSLLSGTYYVGFAPVSGYARTLADLGSDTADSDANAGTGLTGGYVLAAGAANTTTDAGYYQPGIISGTVLADTDNNNIGDISIPGVTLTLKNSLDNDIDSDPNSIGVQPTSTTSAVDGSYTDADQVQTNAAGVWTTYWLYTNGGSPKWVKVGDGTMVDRASAVIAPGQGMFVVKRAPAASILAYGEVRDNDFIRPLCVGSNLVGSGFPVDQSTSGTGSRQMNLAAGFFGSLSFKTADSFFIWKGDSMIGANGYDTYYFLNRPAAPPRLEQIWWVKVGDATLASRDATHFFQVTEASSSGSRATSTPTRFQALGIHDFTCIHLN